MQLLGIICVAYFAVVTAALTFDALLRARASWFMRLSTWRAVAVLGTLVAAAGVGVWQRYLADYQREGVFHPAARLWASVPLTVDWDHRGALAAYSATIGSAMESWNRELGCTVFVQTSDHPDVKLTSFDAMPCGRYEHTEALAQDDAAGTWLCPNGTADVQLQRLDDIGVAYVIFVHELGHVLGLAHDSGGLMGPSVTATDFVRPSAKDVHALRERYCQ
jgi:hypothetical protein